MDAGFGKCYNTNMGSTVPKEMVEAIFPPGPDAENSKTSDEMVC
jgi:hypothetical protein